MSGWRKASASGARTTTTPSCACCRAWFPARAWRFHPAQVLEEDGEDLLVKFRTGGPREMAEHLITWGGEVRIEAPEELRKVMRERVMLAWASVC